MTVVVSPHTLKSSGAEDTHRERERERAPEERESVQVSEQQGDGGEARARRVGYAGANALEGERGRRVEGNQLVRRSVAVGRSVPFLQLFNSSFKCRQTRTAAGRSVVGLDKESGGGAAAAARLKGRPGKNYARSRGRCSFARSLSHGAAAAAAAAAATTMVELTNWRTPQQADRSVAGSAALTRR